MNTKPRKPGRPKDEHLAERRCDEILRVVVKHFASVGYHDADLEKIASEIGCAKGTLYRYFPTKRELFEKSVDFVMSQLCCSSCDAGPDSDPVADMEKSFIETLELFEKNPDYVELLIQERAVFKDRERPSFFVYDQARIEPWRKRIEALIAAGRIRPLPPDTILDFGATLIYGTIFTHYFMKKTKSLDTQAREATEIFLRGILSTQALAEREAAARKTSKPTRKPKPTKGKKK
jgi:AcrR family transcriptional regulator